ncbi:hypothetical protein BCEN4_1230032 [Burkholderia cenocepacia]|nr:hypothetical protein BCEN4_1230032 [Burkholderia cenocepacia]
MPLNERFYTGTLAHLRIQGRSATTLSLVKHVFTEMNMHRHRIC